MEKEELEELIKYLKKRNPYPTEFLKSNPYGTWGKKVWNECIKEVKRFIRLKQKKDETIKEERKITECPMCGEKVIATSLIVKCPYCNGIFLFRKEE